MLKDPGLLDSETGIYVEVPVTAWGMESSGVQIVARVTDTLFNSLRRQLRDALLM